jgi:polysaccharide biosynthesis protein PslH
MLDRLLRVLFLTHRLPYAPNRGDRIRAYHLIKVLRERADIDLISLAHSDEEASHAGDLQGLVSSLAVVRLPRIRNLARGALCLPGRRPLTHALLDSPEMPGLLARQVRDRRPDVVLAYCSGIAQFSMAPPLDRLPLVVDMVDVDSAKWQTMGEKARAPMNWIYARESRTLSRFEAELAHSAYASVVVNEKEARALAAIAPGARIEAVPSGVDVEHLKPPQPPEPSQDVVFCGVMNYPPNEEAAAWIASEVWPLVRARRADARLRLVGSSPTARVMRLASPEQGIDVTGQVPDVRQYLWEAAASVAPLLTARGIQNKVLEAAAAGLPVVVTPVVAEGLPAEVLPACTVAASPGEFAAAIVDYLDQSPEGRRAIAARAEFDALSWPQRLSPFANLLTAAARAGRK